jgi:hypothetical protein
MDDDELLDNPDEAVDPWDARERRWLAADLRLIVGGTELRYRQEAEYQGFDPDEFDF